METAQEVNVSVSYCIEIVRTVENSVAPTPTRIGNLHSAIKWRAVTRFAPEILLIRAVNYFSYQPVLLRWPIMYQFEFMDSTETRMGKANYIRVLTSQELLKFVGTLHPLPEVTKTLNNREPQKVPRERAEYIWGFNTGKTVSIWFPGSTHIIATLPHIILLMFLFLYFVILYILNMNFKIFFHQNNFGFLQNSLGASRYKIQILTC